MSQLQPHCVWEGDTVRLDFLALDHAGTPINPTAVDYTWSLSDPNTLQTPIIQKTSTAAQILTIDITTGHIAVVIPAGELADPGDYIHELEVTYETGETYTIGQGRLSVFPAIKA